MNNKTKNTYCIEAIIRATYELLKDKKYENIKISEVIEKAQISRATFYRNFKTVYDVIAYTLKLILNNEIGNNYVIEKDFRKILFKFSTICYKYKDLCLILKHNNLSHIFIEKFIAIIEKNITVKEDKDKYYISSFIYGLYGWLFAWFKNELECSPTELVDIYDNYISTKF